MSYIADLSDYDYDLAYARRATKAVGWLDASHSFPRATPSPSLLDSLWRYCSISVALQRGAHSCEFCQEQQASNFAQRHGRKLLLGVSEFRVISRTGSIYAAPTLIYHYVAVHHYQPPGEFVHALLEEPMPPSREYCALLEDLNLEWRATSSGEQVHGAESPDPNTGNRL